LGFFGIFKKLILILAITGMIQSGSVFSAEGIRPDILFPYQYIGNIDTIEFPEPSGISFHRQRGTLFVVGDRGDIGEIRTDGTLIQQKRVRSADFEGITNDPSTGLLYIVIEGEDLIIEMHPETFQELRTFAIPRTFQKKTVIIAGAGIEGITFVPDADHPEGGTFWVVNQVFHLNDPNNISAAFQIALPLRSKTEKAHIISYIAPGVIDLSALYYDLETEHIFFVSDQTNTIFEYSQKAKLINAYAFPGNDQEGITADGEGYFYIAQDSGGIIKLKWLRNRFKAP
jgi:uncharacterized protein YjiK